MKNIQVIITSILKQSLVIFSDHLFLLAFFARPTLIAMAMPFTTILTFNAHCVTQLYYPIEIINVNIRVLCILIINVDLFLYSLRIKAFLYKICGEFIYCLCHQKHVSTVKPNFVVDDFILALNHSCKIRANSSQ